MRASPTVQVSLQRFGVWQGAVLSVALLGASALVAWLLASSTFTLPRMAAAILVFAAMLWSMLSLVQVPAAILRWDGRCWSLAQIDAIASESVPGQVRIAVDLGACMLLKFEAAMPGVRPPARRWLPVQRRGLEDRWHALRCAVHAAPVPQQDGRLDRVVP